MFSASRRRDHGMDTGGFLRCTRALVLFVTMLPCLAVSVRESCVIIFFSDRFFLPEKVRGPANESKQYSIHLWSGRVTDGRGRERGNGNAF